MNFFRINRGETISKLITKLPEDAAKGYYIIFSNVEGKLSYVKVNEDKGKKGKNQEKRKSNKEDKKSTKN